MDAVPDSSEAGYLLNIASVLELRSSEAAIIGPFIQKSANRAIYLNVFSMLEAGFTHFEYFITDPVYLLHDALPDPGCKLRL